VRRTDLGAKGIYYRTMVGPFASMEKAVGMCRTLKAAGGNCPSFNEIESAPLVVILKGRSRAWRSIL
jgi:hypothetical protein